MPVTGRRSALPPKTTDTGPAIWNKHDTVLMPQAWYATSVSAQGQMTVMAAYQGSLGPWHTCGVVRRGAGLSA